MGRSQRPEGRERHRDGERRRGTTEAREDRADLSFELSPAARSDLDRFLEELRRWGARLNLVGSLDPDELAVHVADSLAVVPVIPRGARVVDLGTGAGFPGIPLLIARPDLRLVLVDRREKRIHFLRQVVRTLPLVCEIRHGPIEDPPAGAGFTAVIMRAVAPVERAVALGAPWMEPGGTLWIWTRGSTPTGWDEVDTIPLEGRGRVAGLRARVPRGTD